MDHPLGYAITYTDHDLVRDLQELAIALGKGNSERGHKILCCAIARLEQLVNDKDAKIANTSDDFLAECVEEFLARHRP